MSAVHPQVTVAIPTLNAGPRLRQVLSAVAGQVVDRPTEILVCDSQSTDGTAAVARSYGARVLSIERSRFSHGGTRNLLVSESRGAHVAFLTQDAVPAQTDWLQSLLDGFEVAPDVGLVFGPYQPVPGASPSVARELTEWFASFTDGPYRVDTLAPEQRDRPARAFLGHLGYFTDANGCVARAAWERVPFRDIPYAEDHLLAQDMLRAGYAKVYVSGAPVIHSHEYTPSQWLRRSFDEARALREIYGLAPASHPRAALLGVRGGVGADRRWLRAHHLPADARALASSLLVHGARATGTMLGARADALPGWLRAQLSLEDRR